MLHLLSASPSHLLQPITDKPGSWDLSRPVGELLKTSGARALRVLCVGIVIVSVLDFVLTWLLIERFPIAYESNPVAQGILNRFGWRGLFCFKMLMTGLPISLIWSIPRQRRRMAFLASGVILTILASVVTYSSVMLMRNIDGVRTRQKLHQSSRVLNYQMMLQQNYQNRANQTAEALANRRINLVGGIAILQDHLTRHGRVGVAHLREHYPDLGEQETIAVDLIRRTVWRVPQSPADRRLLSRDLKDEYQQLFGIPFPRRSRT